MSDYSKYFEGIKPQRPARPTLPQLGLPNRMGIQGQIKQPPVSGSVGPGRPSHPVVDPGWGRPIGGGPPEHSGNTSPGTYLPIDPGFGRPTPPPKPPGEGWFMTPGGQWGRRVSSGQRPNQGSGPGGHLAFREWMMRYGGSGELDSTQMWQQYQDYLSDFQRQHTPGSDQLPRGAVMTAGNWQTF